MIFEPPSRAPVPPTDVLSYSFSDPIYDRTVPIYVDVHQPSRFICYDQARRIGDCVNIHSFNDIYYPMLVLAIVGIGGIFTGSNPAYTPLELKHHLQTAQVRFIITEPELYGPIRTAAHDLNIVLSHVRIFNTRGETIPEGTVSWTDLFEHGEKDWARIHDGFIVAQTTAVRLFSSGTTGLPKATEITHTNLIAQHELVFELHHRPYWVSRVVPTPLFHAAAVPSTHFGSLKAGHTNYIMRRFDLLLFLETVEKYHVTDLAVVPVVIAIIMSPLSYKRGYLRSIRTSSIGAAPIDRGTQRRLQALLGEGAPCTQVWGMTETSCIATTLPYPEQDYTGSMGRLIPNLEAKLIDHAGNNISAYNVRGEICVRGPTVTPGYFNNFAANKESFDEDGWFHTGDMGYCARETGKWYIVDREKELIKVRGFQVAPLELEAVLISHPLIVDAAVIGIKHLFPGTELPQAYVVRRPRDGDRLTAENVKSYLVQRLASYKALTGGVRFVDAKPKNASGKILKRLLREQSQKEVEAGWRPRL
ncbi:acyl--CoA ligase [Aspergillus brunneoviolaceus CBS 621.78]|uniref:AMP-binding enzyme n=1 Tax=Aspergillus brunneoviolaceus CBS 621.78 TaxID=1450534 RepID=A0ACD1G6T9_9EURO|nr:AMP-binding enzyme [Aspergillus brunneoviolaceus CBS 621.78]RAH44982.1 AMP-binding enzyme [Aspergillus brunneoviolaceus CBS 621.78]